MIKFLISLHIYAFLAISNTFLSYFFSLSLPCLCIHCVLVVPYLQYIVTLTVQSGNLKELIANLRLFYIWTFHSMHPGMKSYFEVAFLECEHPGCCIFKKSF